LRSCGKQSQIYKEHKEQMDYGKFNDLDELVKGYNQLEKSFTQKCQQLAESERKNRALSEQLAHVDNSQADAENTVAKVTAPIAPDGANISAPQADCQQQNTPLGTNEQSSPRTGAEQVTPHSTTVESVETVPHDANADAASVSSDHAASTKTLSEAELQQYLLQNPQLLQKLLQNTATEFAPTVMCGGGNVPLAPPSRPKSIREASLMAKDLFAQN